MVIALIISVVFALIVLAGWILSLVAGLRSFPRFKFRIPFPSVPRNDFFDLVRTLTQANDLWHPGRGDLPDPTAADGTGELSGFLPPNPPTQ
jgi:hypothetical protein